RDNSQSGVIALGIVLACLIPHAAGELDGAGRDRVHADAFVGQGEGERLRVADQCRLDSRVWARAAAFQPGDGGDEDDVAATGFLHPGDYLVRRPYRGHQVEVDVAFPRGQIVASAA